VGYFLGGCLVLRAAAREPLAGRILASGAAPSLPRSTYTVDYQPWVIANFSGILCVDEVYQGDPALLLAVDPAAPDGDRLVGYTLLPKDKRI
jgi:hypothetical protein